MYVYISKINNYACIYIYIYTYVYIYIYGLPCGSVVKNPSPETQRCGFDPWVGKIPWRREWKPIPVSLPGKFHVLRSLVGYSPWSHEESDTTE